MGEQRCENCRFFLKELVDDFGGYMGRCRRFPPSILFESSVKDDVNAIQPDVYSSDWCGEWQGIPDAGRTV